MSLMKIYSYPEPVLKEKAEPVSEFDDNLKKLADDMAETMYAAPGIGLAAPQVGVSKRMTVIDCAPKDEPPQLIALVNPEIVEREGAVCEEEGCLSVPGFYAKVHRSAAVKVRFQDLEGNPKEIAAEGLMAVACQHEIDHLDGILFVDHLSPLKKSMFRKKWQKLQKQQEEQM